MRRRKRKQNKIILISFTSLLFLFSVGYSAFSSDFLINGKGTIVEKGINIGGVNVKLMTTGSGLYESTYEEGRYIYRGPSPNNYLTLGEDSYRIISKETDGTLKVIKSEKIGKLVFDPGYRSFIDGVTELGSNEGTRYSSNSLDYCYARMDMAYSGCDVWGSKTTMLNNAGSNVTTMLREVGGTEYNLPETEAYINTYLNTTWYNSLSSSVQNIITTHLFNVGVVDSEETNLATTLEEEKAYKWRGKIGLANVSDFVLATINKNCSNVNDHIIDGKEACYKTNSTDNWLHKDIMKNASFPWFIAPFLFDVSNSVWVVFGDLGENDYLYGYGADAGGVFPVFYIKSDIKLSGKGTETNPYIVVN